MLIRRILERISINVANVSRLGKYLLRHRSPRLEKHKSVFFDVSDPRLERYLYWLLKMFDIAGWKVAIRADLRLLLNLRNYSDYIYDICDLEIRLTQRSGTDLKISDQKNEQDAVQLDTNYFSKKKRAGHFNVPFFMFPDIYHSGLFAEIRALREREKNVRVFMGGNLGGAYGGPEMETFFDIKNRAEITQALVGHFAGSERYRDIRTEADADAFLEGRETGQLVVLKSNVLSLRKWLELLAASDFFVAPPGILMPFSHNIIEAMAVGCIPITQYGHLFDPELIDGETCLRFEDTQGLIRTIESIFDYESNRVRRLRRNVINYYEDHLDPSSVVNKLYGARSEITTLYLIAGHLSLQNLKTERKDKSLSRKG